MIKRTDSTEFDERGIEITIKQPENNQSNPLRNLVADSGVLRNQEYQHYQNNVIPVRESKIIKKYIKDNHSEDNLNQHENAELSMPVNVNEAEVQSHPNSPQVSAGNPHKLMSATNLAGRNNNNNNIKIPDSIK